MAALRSLEPEDEQGYKPLPVFSGFDRRDFLDALSGASTPHTELDSEAYEPLTLWEMPAECNSALDNSPVTGKEEA